MLGRKGCENARCPRQHRLGCLESRFPLRLALVVRGGTRSCVPRSDWLRWDAGACLGGGRSSPEPWLAMGEGTDGLVGAAEYCRELLGTEDRNPGSRPRGLRTVGRLAGERGKDGAWPPVLPVPCLELTPTGESPPSSAPGRVPHQRRRSGQGPQNPTPRQTLSSACRVSLEKRRPHSECAAFWSVLEIFRGPSFFLAYKRWSIWNWQQGIRVTKEELYWNQWWCREDHTNHNCVLQKWISLPKNA